MNRENNWIQESDSIKAYLNEIKDYQVLTLEEEQKYGRLLKQGDKNARKIFVERNLKLVVSVAKHYIDSGVSYLDLIQEGNIGLMKAVEKFDIDYGVKFSTYAVYWIKVSITRAIANKGRNIRLPLHIQDKLVTYSKAIKYLELKLCRIPTNKEVAEYMKLSVTEIEKLAFYHKDTVSMNMLIGEYEDDELEDCISPKVDTTYNTVLNEMLVDDVQKVFSECNLKEREIEVLMLRHGFTNYGVMTFKDISKILGVSAERVRQIEAKAIEKIKLSKQAKVLAGYSNNYEELVRKIDKVKCRKRG